MFVQWSDGGGVGGREPISNSIIVDGNLLHLIAVCGLLCRQKKANCNEL